MTDKGLLDGVIESRPQHPIFASALVQGIEELNAKGEPFNMGLVFPVSAHN